MILRCKPLHTNLPFINVISLADQFAYSNDWLVEPMGGDLTKAIMETIIRCDVIICYCHPLQELANENDSTVQVWPCFCYMLMISINVLFFIELIKELFCCLLVGMSNEWFRPLGTHQTFIK